MMLSPARQIPEILALLDQAIERDPDFGPALAWAGICHIICDLFGGSDDPGENSRRGLDRSRRALQVAGDDPTILANAAFALAYFGEDIGAMMALVDRALSLNPSFARGWHASGGIRLIAGQLDLAIEHVQNSMRLSPRARVGWGLSVMGTALFFSSRFDEAIPKLILAIQEDSNFPMAYHSLAGCYAHTGRFDDAREVLERLRAITPIVVPSVIPYRNPEHRELLLSGLRLASGETS